MKYKLALSSIIFFSGIAIIADGAPSMDFYNNPQNAKASSALVEKGRPQNFYGAQNVKDGKIKTGWCADSKKVPGGIGEWIEIEFNPSVADGIAVIPGFAASQYHYMANNRIKDYEVVVTGTNGRQEVVSGRFSNKQCNPPDIEWDDHIIKPDCEEILQMSAEEIKAYNSEREYGTIDEYDVNLCNNEYKKDCAISYPAQNRIYFKKLTCVKKVRIKVLSVYRGTKYNDTCIAETTLFVDNVKSGMQANWRETPEREKVKQSCR